MGFGFRGFSPPPPLGMLPGMPGPVQPGQYAPTVPTSPFDNKEQELGALYSAAQNMKSQLEEIEKRIKELEKS